MSHNERLAIAARLHLLLRCKTGRVTDIEWLAVNADYAFEIARFARTRAASLGAKDLAELANRLEQFFIASTPQSLNHSPAPTLGNLHHFDIQSEPAPFSTQPEVSAQPEVVHDTNNQGVKRYFGGLR